jgi:acyl carrier protein
MSATTEIHTRVARVLVETLNADKEDVTPAATLQGDLGAESIDFLDIVFRLEQEFNIRIPSDELFPDSILQGNPAFVQDGRVTDQGLAELSATSTGDCIDQRHLLPGALVVDVAVPTDVKGSEAIRDSTLIFSGGLAKVPETMPRDSMFLGFYQGTVPCCLGETMVLALENRAECFSIGRELDLDKIQEVGALARGHGFDFSNSSPLASPPSRTSWSATASP